MSFPAHADLRVPDGLRVATHLAREGDWAASLAAMRDHFEARSTALSLREVRECEPLLLAFLRSRMQPQIRGLSAFLYGQGSREPEIILQAFAEFLDADNTAQANRFHAYVLRIETTRARIELARFHHLRGETAKADTQLQRALAAPYPVLLGALFSSSSGVYRAGRDYTLRSHGALAQCLTAMCQGGRFGLEAEIVEAAVRTAHVPLLRAISRCAATMLQGSDASRELAVKVLGDVLPALLRSEALAGLEELLTAACTAGPGDPRLGLVQLRLERRKLSGPQMLTNIVQRLDPARPEYQAAVDFAVRMLYLDGNAAMALALLQNKLAGNPGAPPGHKIHLDIHERGAVAEGRGGDPSVPRLDLPPCGGFGSALADLRELANLPHRHGDHPSAAEIAAAGERSEKCLDAALDQLQDQRPGDFLEPLEALAALVGRVRHVAMFPDTIALAFGVAHGSADPMRYRILLQAIHGHALVLARHALLQATQPGQPADIGVTLGLGQRLVGAAIELGRPEEAMLSLGQLASACGQAGRFFVRQLAERCGLLNTLGNVGQAPVHAELDGVEATSHLLEAFDAWSGNGREIGSLDEQAVAGRFETVSAEGHLASHPHSSQAQHTSVVHVSGCRVLDSWLLLNPKGALLRPPPYAQLSGDYPFASEHLLNRGKRAAILAQPAEWRRLAEPLLVLGHQDLLHHRNYYHWLVQILARICWADETGLLAQRRILLPSETTAWMDETLRLCGLREDRILRYGRAEALQLEDAAIVSPVSFASPTLLAGLRTRLWHGAGVTPPTRSSGSRLLYLSRRAALRRTLCNEEALAEIARRQGFEVISPELLPVAEQVRLLASARGLVAPAGAGMTNAIFAGNGLRSLMMLNEDENYPTYADLALLADQSHRCLFGRADALVAGEMSPEDAPYWIDEANFTQNVKWAAGR
jgi:hypothetical protein